MGDKQRRSQAVGQAKTGSGTSNGAQADFGSNSRNAAQCKRERSPEATMVGAGLKAAELGMRMTGAAPLAGAALGLGTAGMATWYMHENAECVGGDVEGTGLTNEQRHDHAAAQAHHKPKPVGGEVTPEQKATSQRENRRARSRWAACMEEKQGWGMSHEDARTTCQQITRNED